MTTNKENQRSMIEGNAALIVIDIQKGSVLAFASYHREGVNEIIMEMERISEGTQGGVLPFVLFGDFNEARLHLIRSLH